MHNEMEALRDALRKFAVDRDWGHRRTHRCFGYLIRLADKVEVDLIAAAHEKIAENAQKYPIDKSRGNAKKYTEL